MAIARVIKSGAGQAVRLPKGFRFQGSKVEIFRRGKEIVLRELPKPMERAFDILTNLPDDMFSGARLDDRPQPRDK